MTTMSNDDRNDRHDPVNHPKHYRSHPTGIECIEIIEHFPHLEATAMKYIWRAGLKNDKIEDLNKARWYIERAIWFEQRKADGAFTYDG